MQSIWLSYFGVFLFAISFLFLCFPIQTDTKTDTLNWGLILMCQVFIIAGKKGWRITRFENHLLMQFLKYANFGLLSSTSSFQISVIFYYWKMRKKPGCQIWQPVNHYWSESRCLLHAIASSIAIWATTSAVCNSHKPNSLAISSSTFRSFLLSSTVIWNSISFFGWSLGES